MIPACPITSPNPSDQKQQSVKISKGKGFGFGKLSKIDKTKMLTKFKGLASKVVMTEGYIRKSR